VLTCNLWRGGRSNSGRKLNQIYSRVNLCGMENPKGFGVYLLPSKRHRNGRMDKYPRLTQSPLPDSSASSSRCAPSRGLSYIH
jgi:hypothetical protein